jgi:hypothetical protein
VDIDAGLLFVVRNRTTAGYEVFEGDPKTAAGVRVIALEGVFVGLWPDLWLRVAGLGTIPLT